MDSGIGDKGVGNEEVLDLADELNATYVVPADVLHEQKTTTERVNEFMRLYEEHSCNAKPIIPLQPPHNQHYRELSGYSHYMLGGVKEAPPIKQINAAKKFRKEAGYGVYVHLLGAGCSKKIVEEIRANPRLLDSLDVSTPEQAPINGSILNEDMKQVDFDLPNGAESSTLRATLANQGLLFLNYVLSDYYEPPKDERETRQKKLG
jgi:hypothetical protein